MSPPDRKWIASIHPSIQQLSYLLDHVEDSPVRVEPYVVVGDGHLLECDPFGVLEEGVWSPHALQPPDGQQPVLGRHVVRKSQSMVVPRLRHEDVRYIRLQDEEQT